MRCLTGDESGACYLSAGCSDVRLRPTDYGNADALHEYVGVALYLSQGEATIQRVIMEDASPVYRVRGRI